MKKLLLLLLCLSFVSCASTLRGKIAQTHTGVKGLRQTAKVILDDRCLAVAKKCPKGDAEQCKDWVKCRDIRRGIYKAASAVQIMLDTALTLVSMNQEEAAGALFRQATAAFLKLQADLVKYQVLEK